jgi:hypothetical protein
VQRAARSTLDQNKSRKRTHSNSTWLANSKADSCFGGATLCLEAADRRGLDSTKADRPPAHLICRLSAKIRGGADGRGPEVPHEQA